MNEILREHAKRIISASIKAVLPDETVKRALKSFTPSSKGKTVIFAIGKAAWQMARCAANEICFDEGIVITKYGHSKGEIDKMRIFEAGHPVPDSASFAATKQVVELASTLNENDEVLLLVSGGGSALFELPLVSSEDLEHTTNKLLACGADIREVNTVRKRLSKVKGGKFAKICYPAHVTCVIISDIVGDPADMIASGPCCADTSTCDDALSVVSKYELRLPEEVMECLKTETPKEVTNVDIFIEGSVRELVKAACKEAEALGYHSCIISSELSCTAREAGMMLSQRALSVSHTSLPVAFIAGGETVVKVTGSGKGGRNQETALAAAINIEGHSNICIFSVGSDGTDGPTDAAGGYCDGQTAKRIRKALGDPEALLDNNDSYTALKSAGDLIITGPTGTNVNDICVALIRAR